MHVRKLFCLITLLGWSSINAQGELTTLVEAVELTPANMILPVSTNGAMTYRGCSDECDKSYERARLTAATTFSVNGRNVKFDEFRLAYQQVNSSHDAYALVSVDLKLGTVTDIKLDL